MPYYVERAKGVKKDVVCCDSSNSRHITGR